VSGDNPQEDTDDTSGYRNRMKRFFSHFAIVVAIGEHAADLIRTLGRVGRNGDAGKDGQKPAKGEKDTAAQPEATQVKRTISATINEDKPTVLRIDTPDVRTVVTVEPPASSGTADKQQSAKEAGKGTDKSPDAQAGSRSQETPKDPAKDKPSAGPSDPTPTRSEKTVTLEITTATDPMAKFAQTCSSDGNRKKKSSKGYMSTRVLRFFERNAGWFTLFAALLLALILAYISTASGSNKRIPSAYFAPVALFGAGMLLLFSVLLFTRPLKVHSDIDAIFRFAWFFAVVVAIFGVMFLILGVEGLGDRDLWAMGKGTGDCPGCTQINITVGPCKQQTAATGGDSGVCPDAGEKRVAATDTTQTVTDKSRRRSPYLLTVVLGCDYNSVVYRNPKGLRGLISRATAKPSTAKDAATGGTSTTSPSDVLDSIDAHGYQAGMPEGVNCGELPPQWLIVLGGTILDCDYDGSCPKPQYRDIAALEREHRGAEAELKNAWRLNRIARDASDARSLLEGVDLTESERVQLERQITDAPAVGPFEERARHAKLELESARRSSGLELNIAGSPVLGGVVVPVFFLAIALMGALINMVRKLPEFQERIEGSYKEEFDTKLASSGEVKTPISWEYARDLVVFQIIQVLTAAGVAVLAYSWARPEQQATTVIIAFAAGFSSEIFLEAIRGVVDRALALGPRPPRVRAMMMPGDTGDRNVDVPPRGPVNAPTSGSAGAAAARAGSFKVGALVRLIQPVGVARPGAQGVVIAIARDGELIVQTTLDHTGAALSVRLPSQSPSAFELVGASPRGSATASKPTPANQRGAGNQSATANQTGGTAQNSDTAQNTPANPADAPNQSRAESAGGANASVAAPPAQGAQAEGDDQTPAGDDASHSSGPVG
jgi:hypothetical protein